MVNRKKDCEDHKAIVQGAMQHVREALRLLERIGMDEGCAHLKLALNAGERQFLSSNHCDGQCGDALKERVLVRATGSALSIFTAILTRHGLTTFHEVGKILDVYADAVLQVSPQEATILRSWSSILLDMDEGIDETGNLN